MRLTDSEEESALLALPGGQATLDNNRARAESAYRQALSDDALFPTAHRGIGMLYEAEGKKDASIKEYRDYLQNAPLDAVDRLRIERRIMNLEAAKAPVAEVTPR